MITYAERKPEDCTLSNVVLVPSAPAHILQEIVHFHSRWISGWRLYYSLIQELIKESERVKQVLIVFTYELRSPSNFIVVWLGPPDRRAWPIWGTHTHASLFHTHTLTHTEIIPMWQLLPFVLLSCSIWKLWCYITHVSSIFGGLDDKSRPIIFKL